MRLAAIPLAALALAGGIAGVALVADGDGDGARDVVRRQPDTVPRPDSSAPGPPRLSCPPAVADCRSVRGRVVYVESVDPDGDGDLHVVLAGRPGVTLPGLSAIDIRRGLRPRRDPRIGDRMAAVGPVDRGSLGQRQVAALELRIVRR